MVQRIRTEINKNDNQTHLKSVNGRQWSVSDIKWHHIHEEWGYEKRSAGWGYHRGNGRKKSHQTHRILSLSMSVFRTLCDLCVYLRFLNIPSFATSLPCVKYWFAGNLKKEFATFSPSKIQDSRAISCKTNVSSNSQETPCSINNSSSFVVFKPRFPILQFLVNDYKVRPPS